MEELISFIAQENCVNITSKTKKQEAPVIKKILKIMLVLILAFMPVYGWTSPTLLREVLVETGQEPKSYAVARTHDNAVIIVGNIGKEAWALKTDENGAIKWRHTVPPFDKSPFGTGPIYYSVAIMPDDSAFLCGTSPHSRGTPTHGLLTHINRDGIVISEQELLPPNDSGHSVNNLLGCVSNQEGLTLIGTTTQFPATKTAVDPNQPAGTSQQSYWIVFLDKNGQKTEKLIPTHQYPILNQLTFVQTETGDIIFAAANNVLGTEIIRMTFDGEVRAKTFSAGNFLIVHSVRQDENLYLVSAAANPLTLITLDGNLQEIGRITGPHSSFVVKDAHRMADGTVMLFGSKFYKNVYYAQIAKLDSKLGHEQLLDLAPQGGSYWVDTATPFGSENQFLAVRAVLTPTNLHESSTELWGDKPRLGSALDFIDTK